MSVGYERTRHYKPNEAVVKHTIKHLARSNTRMAIQDLLSNPNTQQTIASMLGKTIAEKEITYMSSPATLSGLRNYHDISAITNFKWEQLWEDITATAPALTTLLLSIIPQHKEKSLLPALCVIVAMLAKSRNRVMDVVQEMITVILHAGHASSQVCTCTT